MIAAADPPSPGEAISTADAVAAQPHQTGWWISTMWSWTRTTISPGGAAGVLVADEQVVHPQREDAPQPYGAREWLFDLDGQRYDPGDADVHEDPAHAAELERLRAAVDAIQAGAPLEHTGGAP